MRHEPSGEAPRFFVVGAREYALHQRLMPRVGALDQQLHDGPARLFLLTAERNVQLGELHERVRIGDLLVVRSGRRGGEDLVSLIQGYAEARHALVEERLADIGRRAGLTADARTWLARTLDGRKARR